MLKKIFKKDEGDSETVAAAETEAAEVPAPEPPAAEESKLKKGFFQGAWEATKKLALTPVDPWFEAVARGLDRTRQGLVMQVVGLFKGGRRIDEDFWEELEDILISSDVGTTATDQVVDTLRKTVKERKLTSPESLLDELKGVIHQILCPPDPARTGQVAPEAPEPEALAEERGLNIEAGRINVILMVGVNGSGKTTTTAKLAHQLSGAGHKVMLAAADTFRAAAIEQLEVWGKRLNLDVIRHKEGSDPAAVVYDALNAAKARKVDVLIIDTAGRLHNKANLMEELKKIRRVTEKELPGAPHEVLLVLDATTGQNALAQARVFHEAVELSGLVLCKLDGTAKGGIVVAIASEFQIPVKYIGVGEAVEDLRPFRPRQFMLALFGENEEASAP